jgi:hypothetical protein
VRYNWDGCEVNATLQVNNQCTSDTLALCFVLCALCFRCTSEHTFLTFHVVFFLTRIFGMKWNSFQMPLTSFHVFDLVLLQKTLLLFVMVDALSLFVRRRLTFDG